MKQERLFPALDPAPVAHRRSLDDGQLVREAVLDPSERYRYSLSREWGKPVVRRVLTIGLNPSTADALIDDATIRKEMGYGRRWGFDALDKGNLFAWRETDPAKLRHVKDPVGPENDEHLQELARASELVVCAWGNRPAGVPPDLFLGRARDVVSLIFEAGKVPHVLQLNESGHPAHTLYLPGRLQPYVWKKPLEGVT